MSSVSENEGESKQTASEDNNNNNNKYHNELFRLASESIPIGDTTSHHSNELKSVTENTVLTNYSSTDITKETETVIPDQLINQDSNADIVIPNHMTAQVESQKSIGLFRTESNKLRMQNTLIDPTKDVKKQITLVWNDVNVSVRMRANPVKQLIDKCRRKELISVTDKPILIGVTGSVCPGDLLAILGSSGAGKTTFLNYLTHKSLSVRSFKVSGQIYVNGESADRIGLSRISAYVQQEDIFIGTLTVNEHLKFNALLRMGDKFSYREKLERVRQVISVMGLNRCKNNTIGVSGYTRGISGGEKKRLSFATELLNNPMLLLADEPTSGLDSYLAGTVVECLGTLVENGRTVMCTIHQPSSDVFSLFTRVMVLSEGRVAYFGDREGMVPYLSKLNYSCPHNYNPSDYVINILSIIPGKEDACRQRVKTICDHHSLVYRQTGDELVRRQENNSGVRKWYQLRQFIAPFYVQFCVVLWREVKATMRNKPLVIIRFMQQVVQGFLFGLIFWQITLGYPRVQNVAGLIFLSILSQSFGNTFGVINSFPAQLPVFFKEYFSGMYRIWVYFFTKTLAELPFFLFFPFVFAIIVYFFAGLSLDAGKFFLYYFIITLAGNAALSLGYLAGAASPSTAVALGIGPLLMIPFIIFGGLFAQSGSLFAWLSWLEYISWFKYGFEALMINEWEGFQFANSTIQACLNSSSPACFRTGEDVLTFYNLNPDNFWVDIGALFAIIVVLRIIAFVALVIHTIIRTYV